MRDPWVAFACRVLATFPTCLPLAWRRSADAFGTLYAERAADELRERSLLGIEPALDLKERLRSEGWGQDPIDSVRRVLNQLNYGNPKYLLLLTAWSERFQMRTAGSDEVSAELRTPVPTERHDAKARELVTRARELAQQLPQPVGVERTESASHWTPAELAGLAGVLCMYQRFIADITTSIVHVTECLDGPAEASHSHFPVATPG